MCWIWKSCFHLDLTFKNTTSCTLLVQSLMHVLHTTHTVQYLDHVFITEASSKEIDRPSDNRRNSSYSKQSIELCNFHALIKRVSGNYDFATIQRLELTRVKLNSTSKFKSFEWTSLLSLNVSHNIIRHIQGLNLHSLINLELLDLSYNKIQDIPKEFINSENCLQTLLLEGNHELINVECIRNLSVVSKTLTRLSFQKRGGQDACPLCKCDNLEKDLYHELIFDTCPKLMVLDEGSIKVLKSYLKYKPASDISRNSGDEIIDKHSDKEFSLFYPSIDFHAIHVKSEKLQAAKESAREAIHIANNTLGKCPWE